MMTSIYRMVPWALCVMLLALGLTMGARAAGDQTSNGIVTSWAEWIVGNVIALVGGLIAWTQLTLRGARKEVLRAIMDHDSQEDAHKPASAHNHQPLNEALHRLELLMEQMNGKLNTLVVGQETTVAELTEQDARLGTVESGLERLLVEHCFLHGQALRKRAGDSEETNVDNLRRPE